MTSIIFIKDPRNLLGASPNSEDLSGYLNELALLSANESPLPEIKSYSDALYMNYYNLGLSLMFVSRDGKKSITKEDVKGDKLVLDSIDIYNSLPYKSKPGSSSSTTTYEKFPVSELTLSLAPLQDGKERAKEVKITPSSSGKDLVAVLGEPVRKGGGGGPSQGSVDIWCEWSGDGIMIEFGGEEAKGPKAWETGKDAKWKVLTLFRPSGGK